MIAYREVEKVVDDYIFPSVRELYGLDGYEINLIDRGYEICDGQNAVYCCKKLGENTKILRVALNDRTRVDLLAESEYVRYLYENGGNVANVINSKRGNLIEEISCGDATYIVSLYVKADGKHFHENGYKYREGIPISEYHFNIGKTIGKLHQLSKAYTPIHRRYDFTDIYNADYINALIPDTYDLLKSKLCGVIDELIGIGCEGQFYGMIHFDYNDSNYFIDFETGKITVFDFDNSCYGWFMFDLAYAWVFGVGVAYTESDVIKRKERMGIFFSTIIEGYRSETFLDNIILDKLPLFINAVIMTLIVEAFEYIRDNNEEPECDFDLKYLIKCLECDIPYMGFFSELYSCENPFGLAVTGVS